MSKQHPQSVILIEPVDYKLWRIVERETTRTGVSSDSWREIEGPLPSYPEARKAFEKIKPLTKG